MNTYNFNLTEKDLNIIKKYLLYNLIKICNFEDYLEKTIVDFNLKQDMIISLEEEKVDLVEILKVLNSL